MFRRHPYIYGTPPLEYDPDSLTDEMLNLEESLDDELTPLKEKKKFPVKDVEVRLIFPHWRAGTLPLSERVMPLFPTAYESPRIRFTLIDGKTGERFPGWVVREQRYVSGLKEWYEKMDSSRAVLCISNPVKNLEK